MIVLPPVGPYRLGSSMVRDGMAVPKSDPASSCLLGSLVDFILHKRRGKQKKLEFGLVLSIDVFHWKTVLLLVITSFRGITYKTCKFDG